MKQRKKRGFTIVEMLMVIAVLAVLMGIVSTAASSVIRKSRVRKNEALRSALQAGIATYCQQEGFWPPGKNGTIQKWSDNGLDQKDRGTGVGTLDDNDYDTLMNYLVTRCLNASGNTGAWTVPPTCFPSRWWTSPPRQNTLSWKKMIHSSTWTPENCS